MEMQRDELLRNFNNLTLQVAEIKKLQESLKEQENELIRRETEVVEKEGKLAHAAKGGEKKSEEGEA